MTTYQSRIRNVSIIAHVDHGKTALTESLAHIKTDVGMEEEKGITIKSASVTLDFSRMEIDEKKEWVKKEYRINLIDSPGHVDFSSEVTAALRITDGAICVIDCIEGVCVQTETVLRQAILECVKPVLFINKIDRVWLEQKKKMQHLPEVYKMFKKTIESTNAICHTYKDAVLGDINLDPRKLNVGFGSGYFGYGFTLADFAKMYTSKFSISRNKMVQKLWGNHYFDETQNKWLKSDNGQSIMNGFCEFVLKPMQVLHDSIMNNEKDVYVPIIDALQLNIAPKEFEKCAHQKDVLHLVMSSWLSTNKCVLDLCADSLPSPKEAQKYRIRKLYTGPLDTAEAQSMMNCDANGTLSMYVSKMIPIEKSSGRFIAFGRVFSGTIKQGQELRILGPAPDGSDEQKQSSLSKKKVQGIYKMMGAKIEKIQSCRAGDVCGVMGIDKYLTKSGTLCDSAHTFPFKVMKFSVSPVVNVAVEVVDSAKLKKLVEGLKRLSQYDNIVQTKTNKQGQMIVSGSGELHLQTCLTTLKDKFMEKVAIRTSNPIVSFCEGIKGGTSKVYFKQNKSNNWTYPQTITVKSPNRLNKLCFTTEALSKEVCSAIENDRVKLLSANMKLFGREFSKQFPEWHKDEAARIWTFGCAPYGKPNVLCDQTKGVQYLDTIKSSIVQGFRQVSEGGILCDEPLRGVRCNLADGGWRIHAEKTHSGPGQIIPATVRGIYAGLLSSVPVLYEPMYCVDIEVPIDSQNGVFNTFGKVRGEFVKMEDKTDIGIPLCRITGYVPIIETLKNEKEKKDGFTELLRANTQGKAFPVMKFSHWQSVDGDVLCDGSIANKFVMDIRRRKGMKLEIPCFTDYYDKL